MNSQHSKFGTSDYIILIASQLLCLGVGFYYGRKGLTRGTLEEFALANRKVTIIPAALSIFATCYSGFGMTAMVGEMYMYGLGYLFFNVFYGFGGFFVAYAIVPIFFRTPYVSVYEYVEKRLNKKLRIAYVVIYIIQQTLYVSVIMYVPAVSLSVITNLPYWSTLLTFGTFCIAYSSVGGMKAVIWTDVFQAILMVCCVFSILFKGVLDAGGLSNVWNVGVAGKRIGGLHLQESALSRYSVWAMMFGGLINGLNYLGTSQAGVQRILSVKGVHQGRRSLILGATCFILFSILTATAAVVIYVHYRDCEPTLRPDVTGIKTEDQIVVYYISTVLSQYPGLAGLATAGIFSGSLSSLSSYINTFATITVQDLIIPNTSKKIDGKIRIILCRLLTVAYGGLCTVIALIVPYIGRATPILTTVFGVFGGPLTGVFFLGVFFRRVNTKSALYGMTIALLFGVWMAIGNKLYKVSADKLALTVEGCDGFNDKMAMFSILNHTSDIAFVDYDLNPNSSQESQLIIEQFKSNSNSNYTFPLYQISFAWYYPIGFLSTIFIGLVMSFITRQGTVPNMVNPALCEISGLKLFANFTDERVDDSLLSHLISQQSVTDENLREEKVFPLLAKEYEHQLVPVADKKLLVQPSYNNISRFKL